MSTHPRTVSEALQLHQKRACHTFENSFHWPFVKCNFVTLIGRTKDRKCEKCLNQILHPMV